MASWGLPGEARKPLGAVLERSWGLLEHSWSHVQASCAVWSHLEGHLVRSEAFLEPSWAILDAPTARGTARPGPGEGVRGRGKEDGRGNSLNHLRPEGWWDSPHTFIITILSAITLLILVLLTHLILITHPPSYASLRLILLLLILGRPLSLPFLFLLRLVILILPFHPPPKEDDETYDD